MLVSSSRGDDLRLIDRLCSSTRGVMWGKISRSLGEQSSKLVRQRGNVKSFFQSHENATLIDVRLGAANNCCSEMASLSGSLRLVKVVGREISCSRLLDKSTDERILSVESLGKMTSSVHFEETLSMHK
jgi:hypothetical protein